MFRTVARRLVVADSNVDCLIAVSRLLEVLTPVGLHANAEVPLRTRKNVLLKGAKVHLPSVIKQPKE